MSVPPSATKQEVFENFSSHDLTDLWVMEYRKNHQQCSLIFSFKGTLPEAHKRARLHADLMNYRAPFVRPFLTDLNYEEKRISGSKE